MTSERKRDPSSATKAVARKPAPSTLSVIALIALGWLSAAWALFQWKQLLLASAGLEHFCGVGEATGDCAAVWDSPFAQAVHAATGLPVVGWGLIWGLVAGLLPTWTFLRRLRGHHAITARMATLWTALGGVLGVIVLASASWSFGKLCTTCLVTYLLTIAYACTAVWSEIPLRAERALSGAALSVAMVSILFALVWIPGKTLMRGSLASYSAKLEDSASREAALKEFIAALSPQEAQDLSDSLEMYRKSPRVPIVPAREVLGPVTAPVHFVEFTDVLCIHCAHLWRTMEGLEGLLPPGSFSRELRQYPLDSACNPNIKHQSTTPQRCVAARALICMEGRPNHEAFAASIFRNQRSLQNDERVYDLANPYVDRKQLAACVADADTERKLQSDIAWAQENDIRGTPLVLVNGKAGPGFGPFLYAMVLSHANADDPAFKALPAPSPSKK